MNKTAQQSIPHIPRWQSLSAACLARGIYATCRKRISDPADTRPHIKERPCIFVCWHNRLFFAPFCIPRSRRPYTAALASHSKDGAYAAAYIREFSSKVVRGSSSRGGYRALLALLQQLRQGNSVVITPDGPRGPRYSVQQGAVLVAQKSGLPIVPVSVNAPKRWELNGWDRTQIPKPLSRITIQYGYFLYLPAPEKGENTKKTVETNTQRLQEALFAVTDDSRA